MKAWEIFLIHPWRVEGRTFLQEKLCDQSGLDILGFSQLQKAYLGLSGVTYHTALSATPRSAIDEVDAMGRTILSWASQKGDDTTVAELLHCGADPNITDSSGISPLHQAVKADSENCLRLLIAAKAEVEVKDLYGRTPLSCAASRRSGVLEVLLKFGADMETQNRDGWRPIHLAVYYRRVQNVRHLMYAGADMYAQRPRGETVLDVAIRRNVHSTLRVLLGLSPRPTNHIPSDVYLSRIALSADQETLEILNSAVLKGFHLSVRMKDEMDTDGVDLAEWRRDYNQERAEKVSRPLDADPLAWFHSFEVLLRAIKSSQSRISEDSDDERQSQPGYDAEKGWSDTASDDETGDEESWEDGHPLLGHDAGEASSDTASDNGTEDEESWEDARES